MPQLNSVLCFKQLGINWNNFGTSIRISLIDFHNNMMQKFYPFVYGYMLIKTDITVTFEMFGQKQTHFIIFSFCHRELIKFVFSIFFVCRHSIQYLQRKTRLSFSHCRLILSRTSWNLQKTTPKTTDGMRARPMLKIRREGRTG